jgi:hypothetical protein
MIRVLPGAQFQVCPTITKFGLLSSTPATLAGSTPTASHVGALACYRSEDIMEIVNSGGDL